MEPDNSITMASGCLPVVGHTVAMLRDPVRFFASLPSCGDLVRVRFGPAEMIAVCDPELTRRMLLDDRTFDRGGPVFERAAEILGTAGLGTCQRADHRRHRRLCQPAFRRERIAEYDVMMTGQISACTGAWRDGQILDVLSETKRMSIRTLVRTMFSSALSSATLDRIVDDLAVVVDEVIWRIVLPPMFSRLPTPGKLRYDAANARIRRTVDSIVADRRASKTEGRDLLSALMLGVDADGTDRDWLSNAEIRDQVVTFFVAGSETAAYTIAWALHFVSQNPEIERRLQAEVDSVLAGQPAGFEHLDRLDLTRRIITEALRLYPPGWLFTRTTTADTQLGNHSLSRGTTLFYSPYLVHRRSDFFDHPDQFDPDRWLENGASTPRDTFIPFGTGPRKCIGDQFALTECALAVATIAAKWNLHPLARNRVKTKVAGVLRPKGLRLRATMRTS